MKSKLHAQELPPFLYKGKQLLFTHWNFEHKIFSSDCYEGCVFLTSPMNYLLHHPIFMHNTIGLPCSVKKFLVSPFTVRWNKTSLKCSTEKCIYFFPVQVLPTMAKWGQWTCLTEEMGRKYVTASSCFLASKATKSRKRWVICRNYYHRRVIHSLSKLIAEILTNSSSSCTIS